MLDAILRAAGLRSIAVGNVGLPIVEAVMDPEPLRRVRRRAVQLPAALHLLDERRVRRRPQRRRGPPRLVRLAWRTYAADKGRIYERVQRACVYNVADPVTERLVARGRRRRGRPGDRLHPRHAGGRHGRRGRGHPRRPRLRRAARDQRRRAVHAGRPRLDPGGPAQRGERAGRRRAGPRPRRVARRRSATACARFRPDGHRIAVLVATRDGVAWVDDSKATNPHAAAASLLAYDPVVWVAGGLAKGASLRRAGRRPCATGCAASCCSAATGT